MGEYVRRLQRGVGAAVADVRLDNTMVLASAMSVPMLLAAGGGGAGLLDSVLERQLSDSGHGAHSDYSIPSSDMDNVREIPCPRDFWLTKTAAKVLSCRGSILAIFVSNLVIGVLGTVCQE
jgi:hypothetical protein